MTPTLLNHRYQIISTLGRGGFGETYIAIDTNMPSKRRCVIKKLQPAVQSAEMPEWLQERFEREAIILEELGEQHPQIPRLYGYFADGGDFYLVQEWIEGMTLGQKHQQQGNLGEEEVREILQGLLPVLDFIHSRRIIHRDIKPDNIILRKSDNLPVLIDFGVIKEAVATLIDPMGKSAYSVALGTPGYMASEQAAGRPVYSSDLYSLSLTAIFLLTGKTPQYLETDSRTGEILWRQEIGEIHSTLAMVIDRAIRFHPRDRFATASEMLSALGDIPANLSRMPTVAIAPGGLKLDSDKTRTQKANPTNISPQTVVALEPRTIPQNPLPVIFLLIGGVMIGAFTLGFLGFMAFLPKSDRVEPIPEITPSPEPSPIPTVPPVVRPYPRRSPVYRPKPTPAPSPTPSATPEVTSTPEVTPIPEEVIPIPVPSPETNLTPEEVIPIPVPSPETSPIPSPIPSEGKTEPNPPPVSEPTPTPTAN